MARSTGVRHSPLSDIRHLRDLVRRYHFGFPIIKELLQNADDAGATRLDIGWLPGLPSDGHPLVRGPALFVANNGSFTHRNAWAIEHIGLTDKGTQQSTIGKFGYGLKSVFHLCEAFFYLHSEQAPTAGVFPMADATLFNPWKGSDDSTSFHSEWDDFPTASASAIHEVIRGVVGDERWFCLWLPLRTSEHYKNGPQPISTHTPGDSAEPPGFLRGDLPGLVEQLAVALPLLSSVETVRFWLPDVAGASSLVAQVSLGDGARRRQFRGVPLAGGNSPIVGSVQANERGMASVTYPFGGVERFLSDRKYEEFRSHSRWPAEDEEDLTTGNLNVVKDKASPHAAVVITRLPARSDGRLSASIAVYLPVGNPIAEVSCPGRWDFCITFHGYFFVNSDRTGVEWESRELAGVDDARTLQLEWNQALFTEGTLACLLPALSQFIETNDVDGADIHSLTKALAGLDLVSRHQESVCRDHQWLRCLTHDAMGEWRLLDAETGVYFLPSPPSNRTELCHAVFPALAKLASAKAISLEDDPRIASRSARAWDEEDLLGLLESIDPSSVFGDEEQAAYMNALVQMNAALCSSSDVLQEALSTIARRAIHALGPTALSRSQGFQVLLRRLVPGRMLAIPFDIQAQAASDWTLRFVAGIESPILILPQNLVPGGGDGAGSEPMLTESTATRLLSALAEAPVQLQTPSFFHLRTIVASRVIQASNRDEIRQACGGLNLFRAWDGAHNEDVILSWNDLAETSESDLLFAQRPNEDRGLAEHLQRALRGATVRIARVDVVKTLLGDGAARPCDIQTCTEVLLRGAQLADFERRKDLLKDVLGARGANAESGVRAIRYLLHGEPAKIFDGDTLLVETSGADIWSRLAEQALRDDRWRVIPHEHAGEIAANIWESLRLERMTVDSVTQLISEVGPDQIDCHELSEGDLSTMLRDISDVNVLRGLRMHRDTTGELHSIGEFEYLQSGFPLADEFRGIVHLLVVKDGLRDKQVSIVTSGYWEPRSAIRLALEVLDGADRWRPILEALTRVEGEWTWGTPLLEKLRTEAWLPTTVGVPIKPQDIIHLPGLEDDLGRLAPLTSGAFSDVGMLDHEVRDHPAFRVLETHVFPGVDEALQTLGLVITETEELNDFTIGPLVASEFDLRQFLDAFASAPHDVMHCWELVSHVAARTSEEKCVALLVPELLAAIESERLVRILEFLVDQHGDSSQLRRAAIEAMHQCFLRTVPTNDDGKQILAQLRLRNRRGGWRPASELCSGYYNLDDASVLDHEQARVLDVLLPKVDVDERYGRDEALESPLSDSERSAMLRETVQGLDDYFKPWRGACAPEVIGGLLAVLGDDSELRELAQMYLGQRNLDAIRDQLDWTKLPEGIGGGGEDVHRVMEQQQFVVEIVRAEEPHQVVNLLGQTISVALQSSFSNLLVGNLFFGHLHGRTNELKLRLIQPEEFESNELSGFLRDTAREILHHIYRQSVPAFDRFWGQLEESQLVQLDVTQVLLLDHLMSSLKQFRLHVDPELQALFRNWDDAHELEVEAELMPDAEVQQRRKAEAERIMRESRNSLRLLLAENAEIARRFLEAVRRSIQQDYQYRTGSVPFELFQNADDASVEWEELAGPADTPPRFVVVAEEQSVSFLHWGRPINESRQFGTAAFSARDRGFHKDLEKMLMIGASDKGVEAAPAQVTGKFGMGFKSVFLLTDEPQIISDRLALRVVGGVYPERLIGESHTNLTSMLTQVAPNQHGGTIIRLPLRPEVRAHVEADLGRFGRLAPLLLVFARKIQHIDLQGTAQGERCMRWDPSSVLDDSSVFTGIMPNGGAVDAFPSRLLHLRGSKGSLALGLGARGVEAFTSDVPGLWVTAPTEELPGLGFAMNARFDLDVGRAQLARTSAENEELADEFGNELGSAFIECYRASLEWPVFRDALDLAHDATPYQFWESILDVLSKPFRVGAEDPAMAILRRVLWDGTSRGAKRLFSECRVLPSGLSGDYVELAELNRVRHRVIGLLGEVDVFDIASRFDGFATRVSHGEVVADSVLSKLPFRTSHNIHTLDLATVVEWEVSPSHLVDPHAATKLAGLLSADVLAHLDHGTVAEQAEHTAIREMFARLRFRAEDGSPQLARDLVIAQDDGSENPDEARRAAFAPTTSRLSEEYDSNGLAFFRSARFAMHAPAEELAEWGVAAPDDARRLAFLRYLLTGELALQVAAHLRRSRLTGWLASLRESPLLEQLPQADRWRLLASLDLLPGELPLPPQGEAPPPPSGIDPASALQAIANWWRENADEQLRLYEKSLYPDGEPRIDGAFLDSTLDPRVRSAWLELFILGATHTMGRTQEEQHREFLRLTRRKGWMDVFARRQQDFDASAWMNVVRSYLDEQIDQQTYFHWLRLFVPIFQLSWWLDEYVELFLGADRQLSAPGASFDTFLAPAAAPIHQGGGLSAPPLARTLGIGAHFVLREVARQGLVDDERTLIHCYVPFRRVRWLLARMGCPGMGDDEPRSAQSRYIADFIRNHLGEGATFGRAFDIPLSIVALDQNLQEQLFDSILFDSTEEEDEL